MFLVKTHSPDLAFPKWIVELVWQQVELCVFRCVAPLGVTHFFILRRKKWHRILILHHVPNVGLAIYRRFVNEPVDLVAEKLLSAQCLWGHLVLQRVR